MGEGPRKWIVKRWARRGRQVQFLTVSLWSPVPSSMPERGKDKEREIALVTGELDKENVIVSYTDNLLQYLLLLQQI